MGYPPGKSTIGAILKTHYERLIYPFDLFKLGKTLNLVCVFSIDNNKSNKILAEDNISNEDV